jgi:hypothetical protein
MPIIPPNNTTGLYGVDTTVQINNNIFGNNLVLTGNAVVGGTISAAGNITTGGSFVGDFIGNISGNVTAAGSNTQVQFNNSGLLGADADFTFDTSTNTLSVPTLVGNVVRGSGDGNIIIRNTAAVNNLTGNAVYLDSNNVFMGNIGNRARFNAAANTDLQIVGAGSGTEILLVRNGGTDSGFGNTGNIDMRSKATATGGGFRADGNINLAGNVYIGSYGAQVVGNSRGNLRVDGNITTGNSISATGNITGNYFIGNGSTLTGITATATPAGSNTELQFNDGGSLGASANLTFDKTSNVLSTTAISATGNISGGNINTAGNVSGNYILGDGSLLTGLPATYGNANVSNYLASGTNTANIITTGNITGGNIDSTGIVLATGNITGGNINTAGIVSATGNITGGNINTAGIVSATGNITGGNINTAGIVSATGNITGGNINTAGIVSATGNITGANLVASANLTSTQQTVVGTANVGTTGNIVVSGKNIATDMAFSPDGGNAATAATSRVVVGTGWNGNISHSAQQQRFLVSDTYNRSNTGTAVRLLAAESLINLTGNVTNGSTRNQALGGGVRIGGGPSANTQILAAGPGSIFGVAGGQFNLEIGNLSPYNLGNTTLSHAAINGGALQVQAGSTVLNAYGINCLVAAPVGGSPGNVGNIIGYSTGMSLNTVPTGNVYAFYHGSNSTLGITSVSVLNSIRQAPEYYAFYNADDLAQIQLGSLRRYHEFESATATSGSFAIDKNTAQVHNIVPTGNCTITGYSNMVVSVSDGSTSDAQVDTLTIIVEQGSTPYTITLPTGSAYKYAGNVSTVGTTANSVTMISVTAANVGGTTTYLTTVSPEFV